MTRTQLLCLRLPAPLVDRAVELAATSGALEEWLEQAWDLLLLVGADDALKLLGHASPFAVRVVMRALPALEVGRA